MQLAVGHFQTFQIQTFFLPQLRENCIATYVAREASKPRYRLQFTQYRATVFIFDGRLSNDKKRALKNRSLSSYTTLFPLKRIRSSSQLFDRVYRSNGCISRKHRTRNKVNSSLRDFNGSSLSAFSDQILP